MNFPNETNDNHLFEATVYYRIVRQEGEENKNQRQIVSLSALPEMYTGKKWYNGKKVKQEREIINYTEEEKP